MDVRTKRTLLFLFGCMGTRLDRVQVSRVAQTPWIHGSYTSDRLYVHLYEWAQKEWP